MLKSHCLVQVVEIIVPVESILNIISLLKQVIVIIRNKLSKISEISSLIDGELLKDFPLRGVKVPINYSCISIHEGRVRDFVIENKIARLGEDSGAQRAGDSFSDRFYGR